MERLLVRIVSLVILSFGAGVCIGLSYHRLSDFFESEQSLTTTPQPPTLLVWPAQGELTSGYGWRWGRMHKGIDIAAAVGTPIVAVAPGTVTYSQWNEWGYGYSVEVTHRDGSMTFYAHNDRNSVSVGQQVEQGQQIAEMGSTGSSTGSHLHFEVHQPGKGAVDPIEVLPSIPIGMQR